VENVADKQHENSMRGAGSHEAGERVSGRSSPELGRVDPGRTVTRGSLRNTGQGAVITFSDSSADLPKRNFPEFLYRALPL